jgi:hypothetical protein
MGDQESLPAKPPSGLSQAAILRTSVEQRRGSAVVSASNRGREQRRSRDKIEAIVKYIAETHSVSAERVRRIAVEEDRLDPNAVPSFPLLYGAFSYLEPDHAFRVLEDSSLQELKEKCSFVSFFVKYDVPLYTPHKLEQIIDAFVQYLKGNRTHVLTTGYPTFSFERSGWFELNLANLYFVKQPYSVATSSAKSGADRFHYTWLPPYSPTSLPEYRNMDIDEGDPVKAWGEVYHEDFPEVPYEEAGGIIEGLAPQDVLRLEGTRPALFDLKIRILQSLRSAARERDTWAPWEECLQQFKGTLGRRDLDFYRLMDGIYTDYLVEREACYGPATYWSNRDPHRRPPGGITNLLVMIRALQMEVISRFMARKRKILSPLSKLHIMKRPPTPHLYFEVVGRPEQALVDAAYESHKSLEAEEKVLRAECWRHMMDTLEDELSDEYRLPFIITTKPSVARAHAERALGALAPGPEAAAALSRRGHEAPEAQLEPSQSVLALLPKGNVFRRYGDSWIVVYQDNLSIIDDLKGLHYIALLLAEPGQERHVGDLVSQVEKPSQPTQPSVYVSMSEDQLAEEGLSVSGLGDAGEILDEKAKLAYKQALEEAEDDLREAERECDIARASKAKETADWIRGELSKAYGMGGMPRKAGSATEHARVNATKLIGTAVKRIREYDNDLGIHLQNCVRTGTFCSYEPSPETHWEL